MQIDISFEAVPPQVWQENCRDFVAKILSSLEFENWDLSILFCDDEFIRNLNRQYRKIDLPTDVLSFENGETYSGDNGETHFVAGDIAISLAFLEKNCAEFAVSQDEELRRLLIHGILHLSGKDHQTNDLQNEPMLALQEEIFAKFSDFHIVENSCQIEG